jgi:hypothetical protein
MSDGWQTLTSRVVYETAWMRIREDRLRQPSGALGVFSYVDKGPFVVVIPLMASGSISCTSTEWSGLATSAT